MPEITNVGDSEIDSLSEDGDCASSDFPDHASVSLMAAGSGGIPSFSSKLSLNLSMTKISQPQYLLVLVLVQVLLMPWCCGEWERADGRLRVIYQDIQEHKNI